MKKLIVFTDCGDTLVDESTQIFCDGGETVVSAGLIDGAREELETLCREGFRVAMVADGSVVSFGNIIRQHRLEDFFEVRIISEELGCCKPDERMFFTAMERMGLGEEDISRIVMIGNNLKRDVTGANRLGICSVLLDFSPRYCMIPENEEEIPDYTVSMPCEIPALLERLEELYIETGTIKRI